MKLIPILSDEDCKKAEDYFIDTKEIPAEVLMENAGRKFAEIVYGKYQPKNIIFLLGKGNNAGDGVVAARYLKQYHDCGITFIWMFGDRNNLNKDSMLSKFSALAIDIEQWDITELSKEKLLSIMSHSDLIVDAVLGIGQKEALRGKQGEYFQDIVEFLSNAETPIAAVDVPTGMSSESGEVFDVKRCLKADITVTFLSKKSGLVKSQNKNLLGEIVVADYGFTIEEYHKPIAQCYGKGKIFSDGYFEMTKPDYLIPKRSSSLHKYELPVVSVVGGFKSMEGAGELNSRAALSAGAGIVKQFTDSPNPFSPEIMRTDIGDQNFDINSITNKATAILVGSGMKQDEQILQKLVNLILSENINIPLVLDASAIGIAVSFSDQPVIITPHIGEAKAFFKAGNELNKQELLDYLIEKSLGFTRNKNNIVVLKSDCTYIIGDDRIVVDTLGGPELATPGSGDVLAGLIASLIFYYDDLLEGVAKAVRLHSLAGQIAKEKKSEHSVFATDIIDAVSIVLNNNNWNEL